MTPNTNFFTRIKDIYYVGTITDIMGNTKEWLEIRSASAGQFEQRLVEILSRKHPFDHVAFILRPHNEEYDEEGYSHMDYLVDNYYDNRLQYACWADIADAMWEQYQIERVQNRRRVVYA